jgi:hypothetical protein
MPAKRKSTASLDGAEPAAAEPQPAQRAAKKAVKQAAKKAAPPEPAKTPEPAEPPEPAKPPQPAADAEPDPAAEEVPMNRAERRARGKGKQPGQAFGRGKVGGSHGPAHTQRNWANRRSGG